MIAASSPQHRRDFIEVVAVAGLDRATSLKSPAARGPDRASSVKLAMILGEWRAVAVAGGR
jgi:hypothetical protein